jgi:hypothetical protein
LPRVAVCHWPRSCRPGIDGGLISVVALDLVLVWVGTPVGWLRRVVRLLSVGTIVANAVSG